MYSIETKNQFIELRAQGLSLDAISSQLDVPRATLGRWHHESVEQIQRLRALQWHLLEEQIGHRLEDSLQRVAQRIRKFEDELDTRDPGRRNTIELVRIIRDSRREYLQLRALLLAPLQPQPSRARPACPTSLDPQKRDKTRQNHDSLATTPLPTNNLQQPEPAMSHSVTPEVTRGLTSQETLANTTAQPANAAQNQSQIDDSQSEIAFVGEAPRRRDSMEISGEESPLPVGEGQGEGQTGSSVVPFASDQSQIENPQPEIARSCPPSLLPSSEIPEIDEDVFLGSIVINPLECGPAIIQKSLEADAIASIRFHNPASNSLECRT